MNVYCMLISLALTGSDANLFFSNWFNSSVKHKACLCVSLCPCTHACALRCGSVYVHVCICLWVHFCGLCVFVYVYTELIL